MHDIWKTTHGREMSRRKVEGAGKDGYHGHEREVEGGQWQSEEMMSSKRCRRMRSKCIGVGVDESEELLGTWW
jgi:hypothetical protein